jgi:pimeloyl-ACP methyl ester carboxylesterase
MGIRLTPAEWHGLARLAVHGAGKVTNIVEELHEAIAAPIYLRKRSESGEMGGISGLVYRTVQGSFALAGAGLALTQDATTSPQAGATPMPPPDAERDGWLATLNGLIGDELAAQNNALAIPMTLRHGDCMLTLERKALAAALPNASGRVVVLVHGLCMSGLAWERDGHDHGAALARECGVTPLYLHYNSGKHISTNGRELAALLEELVAAWPRPVEELIIVGFSMGGLVARSACYYAAVEEMAWPERLSKVLFLGTPHHGSPWERIGAWTGQLIEVSPYSAPFGRLGRLRSAGITDLRYGNVRDDEWADVDRFANLPDPRTITPLPAGVVCYAAAVSMGQYPGDAKDLLLGDGLVSTRSGLGTHADPARSLAPPPEQQWLRYGRSHFDLLSDPDLFAQMREWVGESADGPRSTLAAAPPPPATPS